MALQIDISDNSKGLTLKTAYCLYELFLDKINKGGSLRLAFFTNEKARTDKKEVLFYTSVTIHDETKINADGVIEMINYKDIVSLSPTEIYKMIKSHKVYLGDIEKKYIVNLKNSIDLLWVPLKKVQVVKLFLLI